MKKKQISLLLVLTLTFTLFTGCASKSSSASAPGSSASKDPIRIGLAAALTTDLNMGDTLVLDGTKMAVDEINAKGGIMGRQIKTITEDSANNNTGAINAVNRLINQDKVDVILGTSMSTQILAVKQLVTDAKMMMFGYGSNVKCTQDYPWFVRMRPSDKVAASAAVNYAVDVLKKKRVAITYVSDDFGVGAKDIMVKLLNDKNLKPVVVATYNGDAKDFSPVLLQIKQNNADIIIDFSHEQTSALLQVQNKKLGINLPVILSAAAVAPTTRNMAGNDAIEGNYVVADCVLEGNSDAARKEFIAKYKAEFNKEPDYHSITAYDAVYLYKQAVETAKSTKSEDVQKAVWQVRGFKGILGEYSFTNNNGDGRTQLDIGQFKAGKAQYVKTVSK